MRGGDGVARARRARPHRRRPDRPRPGNGRRLDLRLAVRAAHGRTSHYHIVERSKLARAKQLGADHGVNYKTNPDWDKAVVELSDGGVDHVVEVGGPGTLAQPPRAIRIGGKITLIGVLSGAAEINPMLIFARRANLQGISVGSTQMFEAMNRALQSAGSSRSSTKSFRSTMHRRHTVTCNRRSISEKR